MEIKDIQMVESFKNLTKNIVNFFENTLLDKTDISCSELSVLSIICENEKNRKKVNVTEIANELKISKSAVSQSISKLEKKGFVKRKINLFDKKINYISLTEDALKKYEDKRKEYNKAIFKVTSEMGEEDSKELTRLLEKLSNIICDLGKGNEPC